MSYERKFKVLLFNREYDALIVERSEIRY